MRTKTEREQARALIEKATPGPWECIEDDANPVATRHGEWIAHGIDLIDQPFIAAARTHWPKPEDPKGHDSECAHTHWRGGSMQGPEPECNCGFAEHGEPK